MFKRLFNSSVSAVLGRSALDRGAQRKWTSSSVPPGRGTDSATAGIASEAGSSPLHLARQDFIDALADIQNVQAAGLVKRVHHARSMRELWFLRTEFFYLVAQHRDQATAKARLDVIDGHFPRRGARRTALGEIE